MGQTSNYAFPWPENSAPVAQGAAAIRALAERADTVIASWRANVTAAENLVAAATAAVTGNTLMRRDAAGRAQVATPSAAADIATKGYVDNLTRIDASYGLQVLVTGRQVFAETGWKDITGLLTPAPTSGTLRVRRTAGWLLFDFGYLNYANGVTATAQLPVGWRTEINDSDALYNSVGGIAGSLRLAYTGALTLISTTSNAYTGIVELAAQPNSAWPTADPA